MQNIILNRLFSLAEVDAIREAIDQWFPNVNESKIDLHHTSSEYFIKNCILWKFKQLIYLFILPSIRSIANSLLMDRAPT